ncbi:hypothetical protein JF66_15555 [Cryobacterium sp. MLB-32]|uniref:SDR family NAD(P)-dependent oxidoreductase n=1 Tax=Cryobacterium sp. MLB-32 TaxID=1529318 RepID=UPI0004E62BF3|nr:SDR family oxidoreductase [Cryobacterium sp. MLB-32]KFF58835.1 hypothetical protein JF66_15555 [Cryobacterium sp. MLB-32]
MPDSLALSPGLAPVSPPVLSPRIALVDLHDPAFAKHVVARLISDGMRVAVIGDPVPGAEMDFPRSIRPTAAELTAVVARIERELGSLDVLVCAADTPPRGGFASTPATEWFAGVSQALFGPFALIRAAVSALSRTEDARIIIVGSGWTAAELDDSTATAAVQGALVALVKTLARDLGPRGITVNEVSVPLDTTAGPRALAAAVGYLNGPVSGAVTGQIVTVGSGGDIRP